MTPVETFQKSLTDAAPPGALPPALQALWWARKGEWDRAHDIVQGYEGETDCDLIHAYLHRVEGDAGNAGYWYRRAGRQTPAMSLDAEWDALVGEFVSTADR